MAKFVVFRKQPILFRIIVVILSTLFLVYGITVFCDASESVPENDLPEGAAYIGIMEQKNVAEIEREIYNTSAEKQMLDLVSQLEEDPGMVWRILKEVNAVFMGDSRVMGCYMNDYMYESRIIADGGATLHDVPAGYETLKMINPGLLVLAYGINDINTTDLWPDVDAYIRELNEIMETLTQMLPDTYIYVQSIIPVDWVGLETSPSWGQVPDWNAAIRADCEEMGWRYVDVTYIVTDFGDLYDSDGVHFNIPLYQHWGEAILTQYLLDSGWLES